MRKKMVIFLFVLFLNLFIIKDVFAYQTVDTCSYKNEDESLVVTFDIESKNNQYDAINLSISGTRKIDYDTASIVNWHGSLAYGFSNKGSDYYSQNRECLPYLILTEDTAFNPIPGKSKPIKLLVLYVASDANKQAILDKLDSYDVLNFTKTIPKEEEDKDKYNGAVCYDYKFKETCEDSPSKYFSCVWNSKYGFCNTDNLTYVMCGDARDIPSEAPRIISFIIKFFKVAVPIVLVITSIITLLKALATSKEDEIKKAKSVLIRRIIAAVLAFFVVSIVQFVISLAASGSERDNCGSERDNFSKCLDCFVNDNCNSNMYYKTTIGSDTVCRTIDGTTINCNTGK